METLLTTPNADLAAPTATTPKLRGSVEEQAIRQYVKDAGRFLETARQSAGVQEVLMRYGFGDEELAIGMGLQRAALEECRDLDAADQEAATQELREAISQARDEFNGFRLVARAVFTGLSDRFSLRVVGDAPDDLQRFLNQAFAAYEAAMREPYQEKLAKRGYPMGRLEEMKDALGTIAQRDAEEAGAENADLASAQAAYLELKEFMKEIKGVARSAFRKDPDTLAKLGLAD